MMQQTQNGIELRLHTSGESIWYGYQQEIAHSELPPEAFVRSDWVRQVDCVRVLGTPDNAQLLSALYRAQLNEGLPRLIQVASPAGRLERQTGHGPELIIHGMDYVEGAASLGGWHRVVEADYITYALILQLQLDPHRLGPVGIDLVVKHPAWRAFSFLPQPDYHLAARIIATLIDPRWYVDPAHPDRRGRIFSFMGLTEKNMQALIDSTAPCGPYVDRARLVVGCWQQDRTLGTPSEVADGIFERTHNPKHFLSRIEARDCGSPRAMLRASQKFIDFVRMVWLDAIAPSGRRLFIPKYFFVLRDEVTAWYRHLVQHHWSV